MVRVIESLVLAHSRFNLYAPELVPIFYHRDKTRVQKFYFLNQKHTSIYNTNEHKLTKHTQTNI